MHIKFLSHGMGDPQRARAYLLQMFDHNGVARPEVRVLRGNPQLVADLAESLKFAHRYTSVVISWHPTDEPSAEDVQAVLDDFELAAFSGMEPDQYAYTAISHGDHVHIFAARVELRTGHSHNMAPPGGKKVFEHLRNHWNFKKGWARPDDPRRARPVQPPPTFKSDLSKARAVEVDELLNAFGVEPELSTRTDRHSAVVAWIHEQVLDGTINSREDVLGALAKIGTLNRKGDHYVSLRLDDLKQPIRFKGTIFSTAFDAATLRATPFQSISVAQIERDKPDTVRAAAEKKAFDSVVIARSRYNQDRYKTPRPMPNSSMDTNKSVPDGGAVAPSIHPLEENKIDRTRSPAVEEAFRIFELSKTAIRRLASTCRNAVESAGRLEHASAALKRATELFVRFQRGLKKSTSQSEETPCGVSKAKFPR